MRYRAYYSLFCAGAQGRWEILPMITLARVKRGMYFDSITLMQVARALHELEGVDEAALLMATPANLQLLARAGLTPFTGVDGEPYDSDALIVVRARDEAHAQAALDLAETRLLRTIHETTPTSEGPGHSRQARSLEEAARAHPQANIAVISVPGMYAALEAGQALRAGLHVFLFSDNVSLEDEVALKRLGAECNLLVMGPDCGTARLNGVGLGFVNVVPDGPVGLVGASGTGMQQVMCLLAQAGHGISQAIGCGGRDLSAEVGGLTTLQGLRMLQEDEQTRVIVLISKPPAPAVAERVLAAAAESSKPVVVIFLGAASVSWQNSYGAHLQVAYTLTEAAQLAAALCEIGGAQDEGKERSVSASSDASQETSARAPIALKRRAGQPPYLAALFSGGTLCEEALYLWDDQLGPIYSNIPLKSAWRWNEAAPQAGHYALDLGADEYTRGRPHPMIDPGARLKYLRRAASNPAIGVILLDIVLGYCAHPDPASIYAPLIQESRRQNGQPPRYIISLCGTEDDPQRLSYQRERLQDAGAEVYTSNAEAALRCLELLQGG
jgi:FdrA protein